MLIGLKLSPSDVDYATLERAWAAGGASSAFDSLWSFDHLYPSDGPGACLEGWTTLAVMAHLSGTKLLGHLVLAAPYRHPAILAKSATVMDHATGGRFVLGLGAGHRATEAVDFDLPLPAAIGERMALLEATLRSIRSLWGRPDPAGDAPPVTSAGLPFGPPSGLYEPPNLTAGGPPIWIGVTGGPTGLRLVARYADGWNHRRGEPDDFVRKLGTLRSACAAIGRDPDEITLSVQLRTGATARQRREVVATGTRFAAAGLHHLILMADAARGPDAVAEAERIATEIRDRVG